MGSSNAKFEDEYEEYLSGSQHDEESPVQKSRWKVKDRVEWWNISPDKKFARNEKEDLWDRWGRGMTLETKPYKGKKNGPCEKFSECHQGDTWNKRVLFTRYELEHAPPSDRVDPSLQKSRNEVREGKMEIIDTMKPLYEYIHQTVERLPKSDRWKSAWFIIRKELKRPDTWKSEHIRNLVIRLTDLADDDQDREIVAHLADAVEKYANLKDALDNLILKELTYKNKL